MHRNITFNITGEGLPPDHVQAVKWFRKAAEQDHSWAQVYLGHMSANGTGVPQDYVQAHIWFNLAAAKSTQPWVHGDAVRSRERVAELMTPAQIAEAQRLATKWRPSGQ